MYEKIILLVFAVHYPSQLVVKDDICDANTPTIVIGFTIFRILRF
jgi:hypothetical protein